MMTHVSQKGFTLVELLVSVGVFAVVAVLITGAYITVLGYARHAEAITSATNNLAFALENMTRNIRMGSQYSCVMVVGDCSGDTAFTFMNDSGVQVTYAHSAPTINLNGSITQTIGGVTYDLTDRSVNTASLRASFVTVTNLRFYLTGSSPSDVLTPMVRIVVTGSVRGYGNVPVPFTLETLAIMRGIDL